MFRTGPARVGTAEQTNTPASASAVPVVSPAGGSGESYRAATSGAGDVDVLVQSLLLHNVCRPAGTQGKKPTNSTVIGQIIQKALS